MDSRSEERMEKGRKEVGMEEQDGQYGGRTERKSKESDILTVGVILGLA